MGRTHYSELGVSPDADAGAVRAAYRAAMLRHHPDTNRSPDATGRAARINAAWACLRDPDRRRAYDEALGDLAAARGAVPPRRRAPPQAWRAPPAPEASPLPAVVFLVAAVVAVVPTMMLVALSHGWDGSVTHPARLARPAPAAVAPPRSHTAPMPASVHGPQPPDDGPQAPPVR